MRDVVLFLQKSEVFALIKEQLGDLGDAQEYFDRYFKPYGGGFIPIIDPDTLKFFTQKDALRLIEERVGFPRPNAQYLQEYFFRAGDRYIPRVHFSHLCRAIKERELVAELGRVINLPLTDRRRQVVMVEIGHVIRSHQIDFSSKKHEEQSIEKEA